MKEVRRVGAREGYDLWAEDYDETANPVVAMDARHTLGALDPHPIGRWAFPCCWC